MTDLADIPAERLLHTLEQRQEDAIRCEAEEARAKAKLEATQGALMDYLKNKGHPVEVAKKLLWGDDRAIEAHEEYLKAMIAYKSAQAGQIRAREALDLWRTLRADMRRV